MAWDGQRVLHARIEPRPLMPLASLLRGKRPEAALQIIPILFGLCGQAQAAAAAAALDAAASGAVPVISLARERSVLAEALQELLWRMLLDLPLIMQMPENPELFARLRRLLADCRKQTEESVWQERIADLEHAVNDALLGHVRVSGMEDADAFLQALRTADTSTARMLLACWNDDLHAADSPTPLMPIADSGQVQSELASPLRNDAGFSSRPHWQGLPAETGALARMQHCPLIAQIMKEKGVSTGLRLFARLLEIGELFSRLRAPAPPEDSFVQGAPYGAGTGMAWVQNARGLLLHRAVLDKQGAIADYCLVAPTEWNFHPEGPCAQGLRNRPAATHAQAMRDAELLVHALDPCVAYQIEVDHA